MQSMVKCHQCGGLIDEAENTAVKSRQANIKVMAR